MKVKKTSMYSAFELFLDILTGGRYSLKKTIKNNPELLNDIENIKGMFNIEKMKQTYAELDELGKQADKELDDLLNSGGKNKEQSP